MEQRAGPDPAARVPSWDACGQHSGSGGRLHRFQHHHVGGDQCHRRWLPESYSDWDAFDTNTYSDSNSYAYTDSYANSDSNSYAYTDSYANCDSNSNAHTDGYANSDSNSYAYTDSYANGYSNSYAHTDGYAYCDSDGNAHTDGYANCDGNGDVDAYGPAETKPDTKAASDTAASPIGATRKRLCGNSRENLASFPANVDWRSCSRRHACHYSAPNWPFSGMLIAPPTNLMSQLGGTSACLIMFICLFAAIEALHSHLCSGEIAAALATWIL